MKVLLVGSGGREDALAWALRRSPRLRTLRCAPGSAGIARRAECLELGADDVAGLVEHARSERYDLVVVGPEAPLVAGLADRLRELGTPVFGPSADGARLEGSKVFAKRFMARHAIPTADFRVFDAPGEARSYLRSSEARYPLVVKADGLASGKGVLFADDSDEAIRASEALLSGRLFGPAGTRIVIEERLEGREVSFFVVSDGERFVELAPCQDYKRSQDGDRGANTGGMGSYSPSVFLDEGTRRAILASILEPVIAALAAEGIAFRGVLFVGLMLTDAGPRVLEFNARFGDPETQVLMPRLDGDWLDVLEACAGGRLDTRSLRWRREAAVCVVMASEGYPGEHRSGESITGIEDAERLEGVEVFHAGTSRDGSGRWITRGGRVLGVTAIGTDLAAARGRAYEAVARIRWEGAHHRTDIAEDALSRLGSVRGGS